MKAQPPVNIHTCIASTAAAFGCWNRNQLAQIAVVARQLRQSRPGFARWLEHAEKSAADCAAFSSDAEYRAACNQSLAAIHASRAVASRLPYTRSA